MSRIRTLKPEMWISDDFLALSSEGQLTFIWLISNADDDGRLKTSPLHISRVLGVGDMTTDLDEMERRHMLIRYEVLSNHYVALTNFRSHQRIDKPRDSSLPAPPNTKTSRTRPRRVAEHSQNDPGIVPDHSRLARGEGSYRSEGSEGSYRSDTREDALKAVQARDEVKAYLVSRGFDEDHLNANLICVGWSWTAEAVIKAVDIAISRYGAKRPLAYIKKEVAGGSSLLKDTKSDGEVAAHEERKSEENHPRDLAVARAI